ncbi:BirA family transcriptional regulator, biotin operon repressor / biotin-[acetyl-CoA-carboxylase] ligase [Alteribacillus persepolensis]|uniref:Bifunctional ligase/repressor BirA n=1 Tax=Alteribacillus persepolensis TaxID=568899 RepID=A0A1G7ZD98_9BACI|nr:biotin--[acetyl-CoA-carboxylase] ligase [Alteribacillus persepolensis]SDH06722.1 BirA family transcriptional regulator, biotin operon repressor / biotin-[acetyl-CoA-carboxylase] ligase [Alteribacillus persepolensis]
MRGKLLQLLMQTSDTFVSGQEISERLGISRTAVWKHIEELRKNGYELEAVPRKGYRLVHTPNHVTKAEIEAVLSTNRLGKNIVYKGEVTSTQALAHDLARSGAEEGTIVVADEQREGKGRLGREWHSPPGTGLWCSLILRPDVPPQNAPQLTLLTAVAVTEAIKEATSIDASIKWPNDILIDQKKTAGILTEMQSEPDRVQAVIIGMGINVNQQMEHFPDELLSVATSLSISSNQQTYSRAQVIAVILQRLEHWYDEYLKNGFTKVKQQWEKLSVTIGKEITATTVQKTIRGVAKGITEDGVLMLRKPDGDIEHIYSADIH